MLRRLMQEMKAWAGISDPIPNSPTQLAEAFPSWLMTVSNMRQKGRLYIFLDALDQLQGILCLVISGHNILSDVDNAQELAWLPLNCPENVTIVASSVPDLAATKIFPKDNVISMPSLASDNRKEFIRHHLKQFGKKLEEGQLQKVEASLSL